MAESLVMFHVAVDDCLLELSNMKHDHEKQQQSQLQALAQQRETLNAWFDEQERNIRSSTEVQAQHSLFLKEKLASMKDLHVEQTGYVSTIKNDCNTLECELSNGLKSYQKIHDVRLCKSVHDANQLISTGLKNVKDCVQNQLVDTLQKSLQNRIANWNKITGSSLEEKGDSSCEVADIFDKFVEVREANAQVWSELTEKSVARMEDLRQGSEDISQAASTELQESSEKLSALPSKLEELLSSEIKPLEESGETPSRKNLADYSGFMESPQLARTAPYRSILNKLRKDSLENVSKENLPPFDLDESVMERIAQLPNQSLQK
ncbi:hypothetical protein Ciccas_013249 [Cichlidogyrus casuarinus]|uniref:Uncharacterized protein n=1 Tax=Cichlidogyrus casuarinus TaxID=1844966 RepID=A0ABD2PLL8_9PLAT